MLPEKKKQKRTAISEQLKKEICVYHQENDKKTHNEIADYFSEKKNLTIDRTTVTKILSNKEKWINIPNSTHHSVFRQKSVKFPDLEKTMGFWISQVSAQGLVITDKVVAEKAKVFGEKLGIEKNDLVFSNGWLRGFKQRNNIKAVRIHGEANSAPLENLPLFRNELQEITSKFDLENIFNADETGLFYCMSPNQTLSTGQVLGKKKFRFSNIY